MLYFAKLDINVRRKNKLNKQIMEIKNSSSFSYFSRSKITEKEYWKVVKHTDKIHQMLKLPEKSTNDG